jgi:subtilase family serine protease
VTNKPTISLFALGAACALAACSGGSHASSVVPSTAVPSAAAPAGFAYDTSALEGATFVGSANVASISVDLVPRMQDASGLLAYASQANDPKSGNFRHFLTPNQIGQRFGASAANYTAAIRYFQAKELSVGVWPQRLLLHVNGSQKNVEAALRTTFGWYRKGTSTFLAPIATPAPPASAQIIGAANIVMHPTSFVDHVIVAGSFGNGILYGYSPEQIATAFDYNGAYAAGYTGAGITTGVIGTAGIDLDDVPAFEATYRIAGSGSVTVVDATDANAPGNSALGFAPPPPVTAPCNGSPYEPTPACNPEDIETQLDTEQLASLAPDANLRYYLAYNPNDDCGAIGVQCPPGAGIPLQGLYEYNAELETAIADDRADVLSLSFGGPEAANVGIAFNASGTGITPLEMAALASEGVAVFVSSGDSGAQGCQTWPQAPNPNALCVSYPSTDPNVVSVGGVNAPLNTAGQLVGGMTAWGDRTSNGYGGSGGGVSAYFTLPPYQQGAAGILGSYRNVPDVSLDADDLTGVDVEIYADFKFLGDKQYLPVGGTSVAAPEAAAMWALVLQACKGSATCATAAGPVAYRLGNPNAYFYKIYANAAQYASTFYDVLYGNNGQACLPPSSGTASPCPSSQPIDPGYAAGQGYDLVTGIGVPFARNLIKAVVGT